MKSYKVHSLERGLELLEILAEEAQEVSLTQISHKAGFNPTTAHRILNALKSRGYVQQNPTNSGYGLTLKLFTLGQKIVRNIDLRKRAIPVLKRIVEKTGETAYLLLKDGYDALCVEREIGSKLVKLFLLEIGDRIPLHIGAGPRTILAYQREEVIDDIIKSGRVLARTKWTITTDPDELRESLKEIREKGYALYEYKGEGATALGCPVQDYQDNVFAAISIFGLSQNFAQGRLPQLVDTIKEEVHYISG